MALPRALLARSSRQHRTTGGGRYGAGATILHRDAAVSHAATRKSRRRYCGQIVWVRQVKLALYAATWEAATASSSPWLQQPFFRTAAQSASAWQAKRAGSRAPSPPLAGALDAAAGAGALPAAATADRAPASGGGAIWSVSTAASNGSATAGDVCEEPPDPGGASAWAHAASATSEMDATTHEARRRSMTRGKLARLSMTLKAPSTTLRYRSRRSLPLSGARSRQPGRRARKPI